MDNEIKILVFKTNLETEEGIQAVESVLDEHPEILNGILIDGILTMYCALKHTSFLIKRYHYRLIKKVGLICDELPD